MTRVDTIRMGVVREIRNSTGDRSSEVYGTGFEGENARGTAVFPACEWGSRKKPS